MTKRIHESGTIARDSATKTLRVCLISEGEGSSASFPRSFFVAENARALSGALSFPNHPVDLERPHQRDPLSAIGSIGEVITIEEHDGKLGFWGEYIPSKSKPEVSAYIAEYADKLAISVYGDSDGRDDPATGKWIAESLDATDPYRSVDLVVAAGRGGKFEKVAEALDLLAKPSATAGEKEATQMELKDVHDEVVGLKKIVEGLVSKLDGTAKADLQIEADEAAVKKAVAENLEKYDKAVGLISEAKLTESQSSSLRALALTGADVEPHVEAAKKVLAEALLIAGASDDEGDTHKSRIAEHLGGNDQKTEFDPFVPGFGNAS